MFNVMTSLFYNILSNGNLILLSYVKTTNLTFSSFINGD